MELIDLASVGVRGLAFLAVLQAVGLAWFVVLLPPRGDDPARVRSWSRACGVLAIVLVIVHRGMDSGRLAGEWSGIFDTTLQMLVWRGPPGESTLVSVLGLAMVVVGTPRMAAIGGAIVVASFALTGHTASAISLQILLVSHVGVIAFWFGGVTGLLRASDLPSAAARFSRWAIWLVPWTFAIGLLLAWGLVPGISILGTRYGELLVVKIAGFALVFALAAFNRLRILPAVARGERDAVRRLRRVVLFEAILLAGVLVVTATMTALFTCH